MLMMAAGLQGLPFAENIFDIIDFGGTQIKEALNIPEEAQVGALMSFGIPDEKPQLRPKKPAEEIFIFALNLNMSTFERLWR